MPRILRLQRSVGSISVSSIRLRSRRSIVPSTRRSVVVEVSMERAARMSVRKKNGKFVLEHPYKNRARNGADGKSTKK